MYWTGFRNGFLRCDGQPLLADGRKLAGANVIIVRAIALKGLAADRGVLTSTN